MKEMREYLETRHTSLGEINTALEKAMECVRKAACYLDEVAEYVEDYKALRDELDARQKTMSDMVIANRAERIAIEELLEEGE